jgi:hypothetical protein
LLAPLAKAEQPWLGAIIALGQVDLRGNGIVTDSYDSANPFYSYFGKYDLAHAQG